MIKGKVFFKTAMHQAIVPRRESFRCGKNIVPVRKNHFSTLLLQFGVFAKI